MLRPLWFVVALGVMGCTGKEKWPPEETPPPEDDGTPVEIDEQDPPLGRGVLLRMLWDPGNSGAGISERMEILEDGVVRYVASKRRSEQVYEKKLDGQLFADLRSTIQSEEFAELEGSYLAPSWVHDASRHRMIVATATGSRKIRYYGARDAELPPALKRVVTRIEEAHAMFAEVNAWKGEE
jgi:hypothetical protein